MPITQDDVREIIDAGLFYQQCRDQTLTTVVRMLNDPDDMAMSGAQVLNYLHSQLLAQLTTPLHFSVLREANKRFSNSVMLQNEAAKIRQRRHRSKRIADFSIIDAALKTSELERAEQVQIETRTAIANQAREELGLPVEPPPPPVPAHIRAAQERANKMTPKERAAMAAAAEYARANEKKWTPPPAGSLFGGKIDD
jgi:hypothetical protein